MIHLHTHSSYSFLAGTLSIPRLLAVARAQGCSHLALTDTNNVSGIIEFYTSAKLAGIQPIVGAELRSPGQRAVCLATTLDAYAAICRMVTLIADVHPPARIRMEGEDSDPRLDPGDHQLSDHAALSVADLLEEHLTDEVIVLSRDLPVLDRLVPARASSTLYVELIKSEQGVWGRLERFARQHALGMVATNDVYFGEEGGRELHRILRAIALNATLGTIDEAQLADRTQHFIPEQTFSTWFADVPEALENRRRIANRCHIEFDTTTSKFTTYPAENDAARRKMLRIETGRGLRLRYPDPSEIHTERVERELRIIERMGFVDYFLVAWDVVRYAKHKNYPYVGRGSGANSIVAYCLEITNVDPIELDLFFERFLNPERRSPPDFDIDFSWRNRDDVINHLLEHYGPDRTAMIGTIATYNPRGALREVGKVLGFSDAEIRQTVRLLPGYGSARDMSDPTSPFARQAATLLRSPHGKRWITIATRILEFPNHYGIHAGGVILAPEPLVRYTATQTSPKGVRITQQDMYSMEDWHLEKLDILSTRGLGTFEDTMRMVQQRTGSVPPILDYRNAMRDDATRALMREGRTIGCFYVESPAMIQLLKKLRTDTFEMLTAASSIIRPGVAQSGMMQAFIERYHDPAKIRPPHPMMAELLRTTFGVMVYQEDVIKVAHFIGGMSLGEADLLRRAMSGKMRSRDAMRALRDVFYSGCAERGMDEAVTGEIWRQMESFAGYSFCKAHSASYAVLSFQEAWLKTHHPAFFLCSVLNNQGGYYRPEVYVQEARRLGLHILLPDVNASCGLNTCPNESMIQLGFLHVKGLSSVAAAAIEQSREEGGAFVSFDQFVQRTGIGFDDACILIRCGACDCFQQTRSALTARARLRFRRRTTGSAPMLDLPETSFDDDLQTLRPYSPDQVLQAEMDTFSFAVTRHVLDHYRKSLEGRVTSLQLAEHVGQRVIVGGWMVAAKMSLTRTGERMMFVNLDDGTGMVDVVMFPKCYAAYGHLLYGAGPYKITGRVAEDYGVLSVIADSLLQIPHPDDDAGASRSEFPSSSE